MTNAECLALMFNAGERAPMTGPERRQFEAAALQLRSSLKLEEQIAVKPETTNGVDVARAKSRK